MGQWTEEGLENLFDTYFATPGDYYVGLCSDSVIAKDAVFTDLTEVSGSGYAKNALTTLTTSTYSTDDIKVTANEVTFNATGTWTEAVLWFVVTPGVTSGTWVLVAWDALSAAVTLENGESQAVTATLTGTS